MFGAYTKASSCHWSDLHVPGILLFYLLLFLHMQPSLVPLVVKLAPIHSIWQFTLHSNALFFWPCLLSKNFVQFAVRFGFMCSWLNIASVRMFHFQ